MAAGFYDLFTQLQGSGFYEFLLPFLLIFAVVFGILEKSRIFGEGAKAINAVIALVLGLLITSQFEVVRSLTTFLPRMSYFIIIAMMFLIFIALFAGDIRGGFKGFVLFFVVIAGLLGLYWSLAPVMGFDVPIWLDDNWPTLTIVITVIVLIVVVVKGGETYTDAEQKQRVLEAKKLARDNRWNSWMGRGSGGAGGTG